jgi:hypothetical protein
MAEEEAIIIFLETKVKALQKKLYSAKQKLFYARARLLLLQQTIPQKKLGES